MIGFLVKHQEDIMMLLSGMCGVIAVFVLLMKSLPKKRRHALLAVEICAMIIMLADCLAYAYRGEPGEVAYYVVSPLGDDTAAKGIFAAGDCRQKGLRQITTAVSDGAAAAVSACRYIESLGGAGDE